MYQYRQVLVRMRQGDSDRVIARSKLMGRHKAGELRELAQARGWLTAERALPDDAELAAVMQRPPPSHQGHVSSLEPYRTQVEKWFAAGVQGTTIHATLRRNHGYQGSYSAVRRLLQRLEARRDPDATSRLEFDPAAAAQVDFGAGPLLTDVFTGESHKTWFFAMTLCWSRHQYAEVVRDQTVETWLACHRRAFEWFSGVVARVIIDNPKCAITRACTHDPEVQRSYAECAEGYDFKIAPCPPADPQKKGIIESGVKYIKRSFMPLREFRDLADANRQLREWILEEAGNRCHGTTREQPLARFAVEKPLLKRLPDVPPVAARWARPILHRDCHVQFEKAYYSAPFRLIGQQLWLKATDTAVQIFREHDLVATHPRLRRPGTRSTVPDHLPPEAVAYHQQGPQWCLQQAQRVGPSCHALVDSLFTRGVLDNLRAAQGLMRLGKTYSDRRLEAACARALAFGTPQYRSVKTILANGLDQQAAPQVFDALSDTYARGGRFCRDTGDLFH